MNCEICSSPMSEPIEALFDLPTVTSDCRPWSAGRSVQICSGCGMMRRVVSPFADFSKVYDGYVSYPEPAGRTKKILEFVKDKMPSPKSILDVGCGEGDGILTLRKVFSGASVLGYDPYNPKWNLRPSEKFDLITLFHVLEHVDDIFEMLAYVKSSLTDTGHVLIQVPYTVMWPFDLILADHTRHFNMKSLLMLLADAGFHPVYLGNDVVKKEITLLAKEPAAKGIYSGEPYSEYKNPIDWLLAFKSKLDSINEPVAVYGTGPAAAWAGSILGDKVVYYIDDDRSRKGTFNGKGAMSPYLCPLPIVSPFPDWQLPTIKAKNPMLRFL